MSSRRLVCLASTVLGSLAAPVLQAQTIHIDTTHPVNTIRPTEALGAGIDRIGYGSAEKILTPENIQKILSAGWQTVTYRQNTELHMEAWHWNPNGAWSDSSNGGQGYFTGSASPSAEPVNHSYGYPLPHRGVTRDDGTDTEGYSRLTDGDANSYWKSNPYLSETFTHESDSLHPQWVILDLADFHAVSAIRIAWAAPFATTFTVQYWTGENPIKKPTLGLWQTFPNGAVRNAQGGNAVLQLAAQPVSVQYVRVLMTASSNTCDTHGSADKRNCVGYAINEIYLGNTSADGKFHDLLRHTPDQDQTATFCSSVDPWHTPADLDEHAGDQIGFDLFYTSGITRGLPAMIPIAMIYSTPEDAVAQIAYIKKRGYPISYIEMGEEADGHYTPPEDYAELYIQFAVALHKLDPQLRLGGPIFTGVNKDIESWPDAQGKTSWTRRFIDYLKSHNAIDQLAFFSFEHYPVEPGKIQWSSLYDEAYLVQHIMKVWRADGVPANVPLFITESNLSWNSSEAFMDIWGGLWLADYIGGFLAGGGNAVYYFHYLPEGIGRGHNGSPGTFEFFSADRDHHFLQPLSQYFISQLINLEWVEPGSAAQKIFPAFSDLEDGAGHSLVTTYAVQRPSGEWSLMIINKDQENEHAVSIAFDNSSEKSSTTYAGTVNISTFGKAQYEWHPLRHGGSADPDGPILKATISANKGTTYTLPAASVTVLRGSLAKAK